MTNLKACSGAAWALRRCWRCPFATRSRKRSTTPAAYALANQVADELELVRERMGRPYDDSPRLPVSAVTELELYFQTQSLLGKANQLAQELAGAAPRSQGPVPSGDIDADDVYALLDDALAQIRVAAEAIGIDGTRGVRAARDEHRGNGRVPRRHRHQPAAEPDAAGADRQRRGLRGGLGRDHLRGRPARDLSRRDHVPEPPPFDGYKRPADVYQRLTECMDAVIRVAPKVGVPVMGLSPRRNVPDDTRARPRLRHRTIPRRRSRGVRRCARCAARARVAARAEARVLDRGLHARGHPAAAARGARAAAL